MDDPINRLLPDLRTARADFDLVSEVLPLDPANELAQLQRACARGDVAGILLYACRLRVYSINAITCAYEGLVDDLGVPKEKVEWLALWLDSAIGAPINPYSYVDKVGDSPT